MMVTGWRASSFTVQIRLAPIEDLGDFLAIERRKVALSELHRLFDEETTDDNVNTIITKSASKTAYKKLLENIVSQKATVNFRTKVRPYAARLGPEIAANRVKLMDAPEKPDTTQILKVTGILVAGNIDAHTFRVRTQEGVYWGPIAADARDQIQKIALGSPVNAMITRITRHKTTRDTKPSVSHTLESIFEAPREKSQETVNLFE